MHTHIYMLFKMQKAIEEQYFAESTHYNNRPLVHLDNLKKKKEKKKITLLGKIIQSAVPSFYQLPQCKGKRTYLQNGIIPKFQWHQW